MNTVTLLGAPDCCLCRDAKKTLLQIGSQYDFKLQETDITTDSELHKRYLERIPVIMLNGREMFDYFVDEPALISALTDRQKNQSQQ